jgi:hypothetical protein
MQALREALVDYYPFIYGSILQVITDDFDPSANGELDKITGDICLAFKYIYEGSKFRFYVHSRSTKEQELIAKDCRLHLKMRMQKLFDTLSLKQCEKFLGDLFTFFLKHKDMDVFFDIFMVSGEKYLDVYYFKHIVKKCSFRIVRKTMDYLPHNCGDTIFLYALRSSYLDVIRYVVRQMLCWDRKIMFDFLSVRILPALAALIDGKTAEYSGRSIENALKMNGVFFPIKKSPEKIRFIIEEELKKYFLFE